MTVDELMIGKSPSLAYACISTADDYVLALNFGKFEELAGGYTIVFPSRYATCESPPMHTTYSGIQPLYSGRCFFGAEERKNACPSCRRVFRMTRTEHEGGQSLAHRLKLTLQNRRVITEYVYFNMLTGCGESGYAECVLDADGVECGRNDTLITLGSFCRAVGYLYTEPKAKKAICACSTSQQYPQGLRFGQSSPSCHTFHIAKQTHPSQDF